jgi:hypothetical protein
MLHKKYISIFSFGLLLLCLSVFITCNNKTPAPHKAHYIDTNATRTAQIENCGSCHKEVYENWKIGPHASSFTLLDFHDRMLDTSKSFPASYNKFVEANMKSICITCHTGKNVFETNFAGINHTGLTASLTKEKMPNVFLQAFGRDLNNKNDVSSGVDCITCHVQNDQVVTHINSTAGDSSGLIKSRFFSDNMNCYSCHHHQVSTMKELADKKEIPSEINCVSCHQEYTGKKKGTHYFFWRNDHASKRRPEHLDIFESAKLNFSKKGHLTLLKFNWTNNLMPHGFSECGEAKCVLIAVYKNKKEKVLSTHYLNRKDFFDKQNMPQHFRTGKNGNQFEFNKPLIEETVIDNFDLLDHIIVLGYAKPQYWSNEKEFKEVFRKEIKPGKIL